MDISSNELTFDIDMDMVVERANENLLLSVSDNDLSGSSSSVDLSSIEDSLERGLFTTIAGSSVPYLSVISESVETLNQLNNRVDALYVLVFILVFVPWLKSIIRRIMFKKNRED